VNHEAANAAVVDITEVTLGWVSRAMCCFTLIVMVDVGVVMCDVVE
jgi:hypothetical protein